MSILRVGLVGAGRIGSIRAASIAASPRSELVLVVDVDENRARELAAKHQCAFTTSWSDVIGRSDLDAVVVSTVNKYLAPIAVGALRAGKNVLCEKPPGRNVAEARYMLFASQESNCTLKIGFTLRFHPALQRAHAVCQAGEIG